MTARDPVRAWRSVLLVQSRALRAIERDLARAGVIQLQHYDVLLELNGAPGRRLRMQELALRTVVSRTRVSRIVADLEDGGLVERTADPDDGRVALAQITTSGRAALRSAAPVYLAGIEQHFNQYLTASQQTAVADALEIVAASLADQIDPRQ